MFDNRSANSFLHVLFSLGHNSCFEILYRGGRKITVEDTGRVDRRKEHLFPNSNEALLWHSPIITTG